jgi:hypothetical protein
VSIVDIQRRLHEAGRIRIGHQVEVQGRRGVKRPARLDRFRLTSSSQRSLDAVAAEYGGDVKKWDGAPVGEQWELYTDAHEMRVIVPPGDMGFSQHYELWSAGGCQRRCDGVTESISDGACLCDPENRECKPHTRLSVMLVGIPGVGLWRIDTQGWYAAHELQGAYELAQLLGKSLGRSILPGRLRVEARTVKRPDPKDASKTQTRNFIVPVLDFDVDVAAVALAGLPMAGQETLPALPAPPANLTPIAAPPQPSLQDQFAEVDQAAGPARRRNSPPPLPRTGLAPRSAAEARASAPAEPEAAAPPRVVDPPTTSANVASDEAAKTEAPTSEAPTRAGDALFPEDDDSPPAENDAERHATLYRLAAEQLPNLPVERRRDVSVAFGWTRGMGLSDLLDPLSTDDLDSLCQRISDEGDEAERLRAALADDEAGDGA